MNNSNDVYALTNEGFALRELGRYDEAINWFDKALEVDSKDVYALTNKGVALDKLGKKMEAFTWVDKALAIDPLI